MKKTILITGATDGIGLETARMLLAQGHQVLLHGRNRSKLHEVQQTLTSSSTTGQIESYLADLSNLSEVDALADAIAAKHDKLDVLINNAGVFKTPDAITSDGLDVRFVVNTIAPYRLAKRLLPLIGSNGRAINLSSAAQAPVNLDALVGKTRLSDMDAYSQSKLAITMWSFMLAAKPESPTIIAVNPGSLLGTKMVKQGFGTDGNDIGIGARILCRAALDDDFSAASGQYFDNDIGEFSTPHPDALDAKKVSATVTAIEAVIAQSAP